MRPIIRTLLSSIVATVVCAGAAGAQPAFRQAEAIEPFFQALMRGDIDAAYAQTHAHFRKVTDKPKFAAFVKRDRLDEVKHYFAVDLRSHSLREDNWSADVRVLVKWQAQARLILFNVAREPDGHWRIAAFKRLGTVPSPAMRPSDMKAVFGVVPSQTTLETMVRTAFVAFANAMSSRSMAPFFATTAKAFQESVTVREAEATFFQSEFGRSKLVPLDWTAAARATYQFAKPAAIDGDGVLAVNARVAFGASRVKFSLKYLIEGPEWRLASFHVEPVAESR